MPGKLIGTNGFIDSSGFIMWPVKSDYFMTRPYEMWVESKMPIKFARIITVAFLLFAFTGLIFKKRIKLKRLSQK